VIASNTPRLVGHGPRTIVVHQVVNVGVINMGTVSRLVLPRHLNLMQDLGNATLLVIVKVIPKLEGHGLKKTVVHLLVVSAGVTLVKYANHHVLVQ
jgi:hypothetical protein